MRLKASISRRFSIIASLLALFVTVGFAVISLWSSDRYHQEVTQQIHRDLAAYVLDHLPEPLFAGSGQPNAEALKSIATQTMMINPSVEVYLLDARGDVLGHALHDPGLIGQRVNMAPIHRWLDSAGETGYVTGTHPRHSGENGLFSVAPVMQNQKLLGYLYIMLASHKARSLGEMASGSHIVRMSLLALTSLLAFWLVCQGWLVRSLSRPLKSLVAEVEAFHSARSSQLVPASYPTIPSKSEVVAPNGSDGNELDLLQSAFRRMSRQIDAQFAQLAENDQQRRELLANISHDLRTPLATLQGYLETLLLQSGKRDSQTCQQYLEICHRHSRHLAHLIGQLFELSRLDSQGFAPSREPFCIAELLQDICQDYQLEATKKGISLEASTGRGYTCVLGDIHLIQRAIYNLLDNALRHTPVGGHITLAMAAENERIRITVKDDGTGIAAEALPHLFTRYSQQHSPVERLESGVPGHGLGLAIVKRILELHGSEIKVISALRSGTAFAFHLPIALVPN